MNKKYLVISSVGDESCHKEWVLGDAEFDLFLIYYGSNDFIFNSYKNDAIMVINKKGEKLDLVKNLINENQDFIFGYDYIWLPDDDISISTEDINRLFTLSDSYNLKLSQASVKDIGNFISHPVTITNNNYKIRYTNFVEVMAPMFSSETLRQLYYTFDFSESKWGIDYLWTKLLGSPIDKIAIIDEIVMIHTKQVGCDYTRFRINPYVDLYKLFSEYNLNYEIITYNVYS